MIKCSIGIMAYNEEENIGRLLDRLISQKLKTIKIQEIIIIASGCTDDTINIVTQKVRQIKKIKLLIQKKRKGKASAINLFIKQAKASVLVMISADTLPKEDALERLVSPFADSEVGMTAAHIIPTNSKKAFMGFYNHVFWTLHHEIAKKSFKAGEMVAWKNVIEKIDPKTSTDETNIAALILKKELKLVYTPLATVYNRGPENISDFLKVRRRHLAAYYHLKEEVGLAYIPETQDNLLVLKLLVKKMRPKNLKELIWVFGVILLEVLGKMVAWYDWRIKHQPHTIWSVAASTKVLPKSI